MQPSFYKMFSERARESALRVRRHQSALGASASPGGMTPAIAARVKEILAGKAGKKKGGKAKGKAAKKKDSRTPQEKKNQNITQVAKQTGMDDLEGPLVRVAAGMAKGGGDDIEKEAHDKLVEKGLATRHADGSLTLSPAGKKWKAAADKGDADGATAALTEAGAARADNAAKEKVKGEKQAERDKAKAERAQAKAERVAKQQAKQAERAAKQKKARKSMSDDMTPAIKAGARHSAGDAGHLNEAAKHLHAAGATCPDCPVEEGEGDDADPSSDTALAAIKGIMDDPGYYAQHECGDILQACGGLQTIAMLIQSELSEDDEDPADVSELCNAADILLEFIQGELDEVRGASKEDAKTIGHEPMKGVEDLSGLEAKAVNYDQASQLVRDAWTQANPNPTNGLNSWPIAVFDDGIIISNQGHMARVPYQQQEDKIVFAPQADWEDVRQVYMTADGREVKAIAELAPKEGPPSADKAIDEILDANGYMSIDFAVKSVGDGDEISGPAIRFGSASEPDISRERDYFTKSTNFWLDAWDKRPMIWHHALPQDDLITSLRNAGAAPEEIKAMREAISYLDEHPMIGMWTKAVADPATVWMNGILDKAHRYRSAIKRMVELGMLKISTDSLPQLVVRERQPNGTHEVKSWPIVAASLTPTAAEPRLLDVSSMKLYYEEAGIAFPFDEKPEVKAEPDRARALLLELELLDLELGIPVS